MQNETNADEMNDNELNELKNDKILNAKAHYYDVILWKMVQKDAHVIKKVAYKHFTRVSCPDELVQIQTPQ